LYNLIKRTLVTIDEKERIRINKTDEPVKEDGIDAPQDFEKETKEQESSLDSHPEVSLAREKARSILEDARRQAEQIKNEAELYKKNVQKQIDQKNSETVQLIKSKEAEVEKKWKTQFDTAVKAVQTLQQTLQKNKDEYVILSTQQILSLSKTVIEKMLFITLTEKENEVFEQKVKGIMTRIINYKNIVMRFNPKNLELFPPELLETVKSVLPNAEFRPDPGIAPGGILVDTNYGTFDATIENQYQLFESIVSEALESGLQ
jgi:flagellar biosynthesis/type III secretory pathway protein FliH